MQSPLGDAMLSGVCKNENKNKSIPDLNRLNIFAQHIEIPLAFYSILSEGYFGLSLF